jgi:hypothetical protein
MMVSRRWQSRSRRLLGGLEIESGVPRPPRQSRRDLAVYREPVQLSLSSSPLALRLSRGRCLYTSAHGRSAASGVQRPSAVSRPAEEVELSGATGPR